MFEQTINNIPTILLTAATIFILLRFLFNKITSSFSSLTSLGAKYAGNQSGMIRAGKAVTNEAAMQFLNSPQIGGLKMIASQLGFDLDGMIEDHGAVETLTGITQLLNIVGIDPMTLMTQGIGGLTKNLKGEKDLLKSGLSQFG